MKYTGDRLVTYESSKQLLRQRSITRATYNDIIHDLNKRQKTAERSAVAAAARAETRAIAAEKEAERKRIVRKAQLAIRAKAKRIAAILAKTTFWKSQIPRGSNEDSSPVYEIAKHAIGTGLIELYVNGELVKSREFRFTEQSHHLRHSMLRDFYLWVYDGPTIFTVTEAGAPLKSSDHIEIFLRRKSRSVLPKKIVQAFADGALNCVAEPLAKMWEEAASKAEALGNSNKETLRKYYQHARSCRAFGLKYPDGIPEGEPMEEMARIARKRIIIYDLFANVYSVYNKACPNVAKFTNVRENHLEAGFITDDSNEAEIVTRDKLDEIVSNHTGKEYLFRGPVGAETELRSVHGSWRVENPLYDMFYRQNLANGINQFGIDAVRYPRLNKFLHRSITVCGAPVRFNDSEVKGHVDMELAYTQPCPFDSRFPAKIQQQRRLSPELTPEILDVEKFLTDHFGIFKIRVLENTDPMLRHLGLTGVHVLPGPEILYYVKRGIKVELLSGAFASSFHMKWNDELIPKGSYKQAPYKLWSGVLAHDNPTRTYYFKGSKEWAAHLTSIHGDAIKFIEEDCIIEFTRAKPINHTKHHIFAFITAYTRINVLEAMRNFKNVVGVALDGIYYGDDEFTMPPNYREKTAKPLGEGYGVWFTDCSDVDDSYMSVLPDVRFLKNCMLSGAGGTGKTTTMLKRASEHDYETNFPFIDVIFIVPHHNLGKGKQNEDGIWANYQTYHAMAGMGIDNKKTLSLADKGRQPSVGFMDELTLAEPGLVQQTIDTYPHTLFYIAGDVEYIGANYVGFQCRNGTPKVGFSKIWEPPASWAWYTFLEDKRSQDEEIKTLKKAIRDKMREVYTDGGCDDSRRISQWIIDTYPTITMEEAVALFTPQDTWIAGSKITSTRLLTLGVNSGWICTAKGKEDKGARSKEEIPGWEPRGCFTTHSFQGSTVDTGKLFVSVQDAFEHAMCYTAISRARRMDQIILVR